MEGCGAAVTAQQVASLLTAVARVVVDELGVTPILPPIPEARFLDRLRTLGWRH